MGEGLPDYSNASNAQWATETAQQIADEIYAAVGVLLQHELESPLSKFDISKVCRRLSKQYNRKPLVEPEKMAQLAASSEIAGMETTTPPKRPQRGTATTADDETANDDGNSCKRKLRERHLSGDTEPATPVATGTTRKAKPRKTAKKTASRDDRVEPTPLSCISVAAIVRVNINSHTATVLLKDDSTQEVTYAGANRTEDDIRLTDEIYKSQPLMQSFSSKEWESVLALQEGNSGNEVPDAGPGSNHKPDNHQPDTELSTITPGPGQSKRQCNSDTQRPGKRARLVATTAAMQQKVGDADPAVLKGMLQQWLAGYNENPNPEAQIYDLLQNLPGVTDAQA